MKLKKKITLNRETLRHLSNSSLRPVVGGGTSLTYCDELFCFSGVPLHCAGTDEFSWCVCAE